MNQATLDFARQHRDDDVRQLALRGARGADGVDMHQALQQISGYQTACRKLPLWAACDVIEYPVRLSMEQSSSQATAWYKRGLVAGLAQGRDGRFADLTGGLGVDFSFMAPCFSHATYVERNHELCSLARRNMAALGIRNASFVEDSAEHVLPALPHQSLVFVDPARRDTAGRRLFLVTDCQPDVAAMHDELVAKADVVLLKLSPMLDIRHALRTLPATRRVHVVAVDGKCKELLFVLSASELDSTALNIISTGLNLNSTGLKEGCTPITAVNLPADGDGAAPTDALTFTYDEEYSAAVSYATAIGRFVYEPNAAVLKAGAFRTVAARYNIYKVAADSHLYTADNLVPDFPGRTFAVHGVQAMRSARTLAAGLTHANVLTRNFPLAPDELRRRLRLKDGGSEYIIGTTDNQGQHILIRASR